MRGVKAIVFDLDGTLINTAGKVLESVNYALEPWGIEVDYQGIEKIRDRVSQNLFSGFGLSKSEQKQAFERIKRYTLDHLDSSKLFDGIEDLLKVIKLAGIKMAVWTGRDSESAKLLLNFLAIDSYFEVVIGNSDVELNKPHPEGLLKVVYQLGVSPVNSIMIGDHDHDLIGGKRIGARTIRVNWAPSPQFRYGNIWPDFEFNTPCELRKWIEQWDSI